MINNFRKTQILAFFWLLTAFSPVFGGGNRDIDINKADELINEKKYDEAIIILSSFARRNPDKFDLAQDRLRKIYKIRDEFSRTAEELLDTVTNDPDNSEKILALSKRMEELEDSTNPVLLSFIGRIRGLAQFSHDRKRLADILEQGRVYLDRGDCNAALQTYASGMDFYRREFFEEGYGEIIENQVRRETQRINLVLEEFQARSSTLGSITTEMARAINAGNFASAREISGRLSPVMDRFIELEQILYSSVISIERILDELKNTDHDMGDRNHLAFLSHIIRGRQGESIQEGMLGAFETYWNNSTGTVVNSITQNMQRIYTSGLDVFRTGDYPAATRTLERMDEYSRFSPLFFEKHLKLKEGEESKLAQLFDQQIVQNDIPLFIKIKSVNEASSSLIQTANLFSRGNILANIDSSSLSRWQGGNINTNAALTMELQTRESINNFQKTIENIIADTRKMDSLITQHHDTGDLKTAISAIENIQTAVTAEVRQSTRRYYSIVDADLRKNLSVRKEELEKGNILLQGQRRSDEDGSTVIDHFPAEALETLTAMLQVISEDIDRGNSTLSRYSGELATMTTHSDIKVMHENIQANVNEMAGIRSQGANLIVTARSNVAQAETYRQEGERLLREAQAAFGRQSFDTARDRLQRAIERFTNSLEIQESPSLRQAWDTQVITLGQAISQAENELIIAEVRNLVNNARTVYFAGNFEQAEEQLVRARNRWRLTNPEENEEIIYWLGIVRGALSIRSGRIIPATAPLYPEMSQLLSGARKNFDEGVRLINAGNRSSGIAKFEEARRQTREVKLMFPVNQEAGILELRMDYYTDPGEFNTSFEQRLRRAIAGTKQRSIESFADLQNLAEINPRYPGIAGILNQAEIDMGYRLPPPNPANIARSRELTQSANRILDGNNSTQYEIALTQINEAITLNPENMEAARVKDRLLNRMGAPGAIVLNSQDEAEYQRAVRELQAGNNLAALSLVERLMQNPRNQNITKLIELQRRIQSVL